MYLIDHQNIYGTERIDNQIVIPELNRNKPSAPQFIKLVNLNITLNKPTAFLYVDGFSTAQSESGIFSPLINNYVPAIKAGASYMMHEWIYTFKNLEHLKYANIISSSCAAGIQAIYEAQKLLESNQVSEVIIIGCERTTEYTLSLFRELGIDIICGDGFVYMKLSKQQEEIGKLIYNIKWKFKFSNNPFFFSKETLNTLIPDYKVDFVKLHGTGTKSNTEAEEDLAKIGLPITYKSTIGHTQGISSILETSILLKTLKGKTLVTANGFGGFYGAFTIRS